MQKNINGRRVAILVTEGFEETLGPIPDGVTKTTALSGPLDIAVFFTTSKAALDKRFATLAKAVAPSGCLWISWPKRAALKEHPEFAGDLDENAIRAIALPSGLVDVKVCAVDEIWSGLKLVWRKERRGAAR